MAKSIIGCGKIAHKFVTDLALSEQSILYACAARDINLSRFFAEKHSAKAYFDSYDDLVLCPEVDVIYIATPHSFHMEHTLLCLRSKKAVLCEKPLAINSLQVNKMINTARVNQTFLMEAMWTAFLPNIINVHEFIKSNKIGQIRHLTADFGFKAEYNEASRLFNPELAGGALLDIGIYPIFISLLLLGKPKNIEAAATISPSGVDSSVSLLFTYDNGCTAFLFASVDVDSDTKCEIFGTEGKIEIPNRFHGQDHFILTKKGSEDQTIKSDLKGLGYYHEIEHVNNCLLKGFAESPVFGFDMSRQLIEIMDEVRKIIEVKYPGE
ncbi:MAG: Gfo/Idh/MocA family oxidoreductase [Saprospiraceae bacterium]|nr:Gfo/Idh/MocA family oxidoreductase [Saprospiraceae bacterium]